MQATSFIICENREEDALNILRPNAFAATGSESLSRLRFLRCAPTACGRFLHRSALPAQRVPLHLIDQPLPAQPDPDHWADIFARAGAKYVALTSKHHEGFTLWRNAEANKTWGRPWNAVDVGPKRDIALDLMEAGRRKNLHMGIYYSLYEWYNPL